jgi:hypothetical protein
VLTNASLARTLALANARRAHIAHVHPCVDVCARHQVEDLSIYVTSKYNDIIRDGTAQYPGVGWVKSRGVRIQRVRIRADCFFRLQERNAPPRRGLSANFTYEDVSTSGHVACLSVFVCLFVVCACACVRSHNIIWAQLFPHTLCTPKSRVSIALLRLLLLLLIDARAHAYTHAPATGGQRCQVPGQRVRDH